MTENTKACTPAEAAAHWCGVGGDAARGPGNCGRGRCRPVQLHPDQADAGAGAIDLQAAAATSGTIPTCRLSGGS